jgi:signal transduction histidine kinase
MQAVPDLVFLLGLDGTYIDIFSAADEDLFLPREQLIGKTVSEVLPPPVGADCMAAIARLSSSRDVSSFSYELQIENRPRWFEGRVALCNHESVIVLVRDFTEQRLAERSLREANVALSRRARQLQRLEEELARVEQRERRRLAELLHDNLQQLVVGAKFNLTVLRDGLEHSEQKEQAGKIMEIVDLVIDHSRLLTAELYPTTLYEGTLEQSLAWIQHHVARLHGLQLEVGLEAPAQLKLPEAMTFTVFNAIMELLLNVVKHSGVKTATLTCSVPTPQHLFIAVQDKGKGFTPSRQVDAGSNMENFGLFNLRERISWLHGDVAIDSQPGAGCTVTLHVPLNLEASTTEKLTMSKSWEPVGSSPSDRYQRIDGQIRILLVDDHAIIREGLSQILLKDKHFQVVGEAPDGETAVALAAQLQPDVILMDVTMPGMGGVETTRLIKSASPHIHIIALSMFDEREKSSEMREAGASDYINKSKAASNIAETILKHCRR